MSRHQRFSDERLWQLRQQLSQRHRTWCDNMKATDVDGTDSQLLESVFIEYVFRRPVALVDYKWKHWSHDVNADILAHLATMCALPAFVVAYTPDEPAWSFQVWPLNDAAEQLVPIEWRGQSISERRYVRFMHLIRGVHCCASSLGGES